jgi:glycosyltransferase involved in cell wall biosynthesis
MIIAVNTRMLLPDFEDGIGRFSFEILKRITTQNKQHTFIFFFDRPFNKKFIFSENIIPVVLFPPARSPFLWICFFEFAITKALKKYKPDVFVSPDGWLSLQTNVKSLQVLHDLHFTFCPQFLPYFVRSYFTYFFPKFINKASHIVTVSSYCKNQIMKEYAKESKDIDVVYNASRENYKAISGTRKQDVKKKYTNNEDYFLFIGPIHARKNLPNVIQAFERFKAQRKTTMKLVIIGKTFWRKRKYRAKTNDSDVIYLDYIASEELYAITASAFCLVYASFYEGFGIPMIEAMNCGVPVIASNCSAMPEIVGESAVLINPNSVDSITEAMLKMENDSVLREILIEKAYKNCERFSWDNSANLFWNCILKTVVK